MLIYSDITLVFIQNTFLEHFYDDSFKYNVQTHSKMHSENNFMLILLNIMLTFDHKWPLSQFCANSVKYSTQARLRICFYIIF
jgi:hypothetical protein